MNLKTAKKGNRNCVYELEGDNNYTWKKLKKLKNIRDHLVDQVSQS